MGQMKENDENYIVPSEKQLAEKQKVSFWFRLRRFLSVVTILIIGFGAGFFVDYSRGEGVGGRVGVSLWDIDLDKIENLDEPLYLSVMGSEMLHNEVSTTSAEMVFQILEAYPKIPYPDYVPQGFLFDSITVSNIKTNDWSVTYIYVGAEDGKLFITVSNQSREYTSSDSIYINDPRDITIDDEVFISYQEDPLEPNNAYLKKWITGQAVSVAGPFEKWELESIVESLDYEPN